MRIILLLSVLMSLFSAHVGAQEVPDAEEISCEKLNKQTNLSILILIKEALEEEEDSCVKIDSLLNVISDEKSMLSDEFLINQYEAVSSAKDKKPSSIEKSEYRNLAVKKLLEVNKKTCDQLTTSFEVPMKEKVAELVKNKNLKDIDLDSTFDTIIQRLLEYKKDGFTPYVSVVNEIKNKRNSELYKIQLGMMMENFDQVIVAMLATKNIYNVNIQTLKECKDEDLPQDRKNPKHSI